MIRRLYRAVVPQRLRAAIRRRVSPTPPKPVIRKTRSFELPLPIPPASSGLPSPRTSLQFDVPIKMYVPRVLEAGGLAGYEPETAAVLLGLVDVLRPDVLFDVGANVGPFCLLVPALFGIPAVGFEPAPLTASVLRTVVAANVVDCTVEQAAVGEAEGEAVLYISPTDTSTSLVAGWRAATGEVTVPVRTLDEYCAATGRSPSVIKIDVETNEPGVFRGASALLAKRPWIVCEAFPGKTEPELEALLFPLGYQAYHINGPAPLVRADRIVGNTTEEHLNWLFAPEEPSEQLWSAVEAWRQAVDATPTPVMPEGVA